MLLALCVCLSAYTTTTKEILKGFHFDFDAKAFFLFSYSLTQQADDHHHELLNLLLNRNILCCIVLCCCFYKAATNTFLYTIPTT